MPRLSERDLTRLEPRLPARPEIVARVLELSRDQNTSMSALARVIAQDPGIAARVLRMANSSLYGFPYRVATIDHAVVLLGLGSVRDLVVASVIINRFDGADQALDMTGFWQHSLAVGVIARILARSRGGNEPERQFLHGLLHDTGKLVLAMLAPREYRLVTEAVAAGMSIDCAERELVGIEHNTAGAALFERWGLPRSFVQVARWHHHPGMADSGNAFSVTVIHVANALARAALLGDQSWVGPVPPVEPTALEALGIEEHTLPLIVEEAASAFEEALASLGVHPAETLSGK